MSEQNSLYTLYLNGKFYGAGELERVNELIKAYLIDNKCHGYHEVNFKIKKVC